MRASWLAFCFSRRSELSLEKKRHRFQGVARKRPATASGCGGAGPSAASPLLSDAQWHRPRRGSWHPTPRRSQRRSTPFFSNLLDGMGETMKHKAGLFVLALAVLVPHVRADEGMWPYNNVPARVLKQKYGWAPDQKWLDHVRLASVRFNNGGSGSFVAATGLVLTNHHVGANCIQKISSPEHDYIKNGYVARSAAEEVKCPDLELNALEGIEDATARVNADVKPGMTDAQVLEAQKAAQARLEKECNEK